MVWSLFVQAAKTVSLILFYYCFSIGLTFYNKWILTGYPFPVTITMFHLVMKFLLAWLLRNVWACWSKNPPVVVQWKEYLKNVAPIAVFSALDIGLSNWSLVFITISLYTMSKSTALIFILLFSVLLRLEKLRLSLIFVVVMIVIGLLLFTYESTSFNLEGFILVMCASIITGLRWSTAQLALHKEELGLSNPIDMVFHLQPVMIITLLPLAIPVDGVAVSTSVLVFRATNFEEFGWTVAFVLPAALLAFMLGTSEYLLVYHTSGLTLSIAGVFKEILILTISTMWWEEETLETIHLVGMVVCVAGIGLHVLLKAWHTRSEAVKGVEQAAKELALSEAREDTMKLIPRHRREEGGGESDSDNSEVLYETSHM